MDTNSVMELVGIIVLLLLSGFFSSAETALTTVNTIRMKALADEGNKQAKAILHVKNNSSKMLSTILIGNNFVNMFISALTTTITIRIWGNQAVGIATGILTFLVLLFGEITPKHLATIYAEPISFFYIYIIQGLMKLLTPLVVVVDFISKGILKLFHVDTSKKTVMTENELRTIVDTSHEDGVIEKEERQIIHNLFDFGDAYAKDIMVPRIDMSCVDIASTYEELIAVYKQDKYTRIPIYEEDTNNVVGIVNVKDLLLIEHGDSFRIQDVMRPAYYTYEYKHTSELLILMKNQSINMAIVLDEYGATSGLITLEDLLEEIVGEIRDEYDEEEEELLQEVAVNEYSVEGSMKLDDINDILDLDLDSKDYDSIGGLIIELIDRIPEVGESVTTSNGITLVVEAKDKNRIDRVHMYLPQTVQTSHVLYEGRPTDQTDRTETEIQCYDFLEQLHIPFFRVDHEPMATIEDSHSIDDILQTKMCKNLFLCNAKKNQFYLLLMPGDKRFKTKDLSSQLNISRLSFADETYMKEYLKLTAGSVSILGLMHDEENKVRLLIDKDVLKDEYIACHPCNNTTSLKIKTKDVLEKVLPAMDHEATLVTL
ncbi:MAG: DUF21 domain-containing protein [Lachnospiraceae bacterium]|nr:DUF21 domain-containing protein [Lachnospiraceae bacterium]